MNEPNSVIADLLQLTLLAGSERMREGDATRQIARATPDDFKHISFTAQCTYPPAVTPAGLFSFTVPASQCLIVNYVSLYATLADGSSPAVNFGVNYNMATYLGYSLNGEWVPLSSGALAGQVVNCSIFVIFPPGSIPTIRLTKVAYIADGTFRIMTQWNGFLADSQFFNRFAKYRTMFPA